MSYLPTDWQLTTPENVNKSVVGAPSERPPEASKPPAGYNSSRQPHVPPPLTVQSIQKGGVMVGIAWMVGIGLLLFWLPFFGSFIAGAVGGKKSGGVLNGILSALIPAFLLASLFLQFSSFLGGIPVLGLILTLGRIGIAFSAALPLLMGGIVGGLFATNASEPVSKPALIVVIGIAAFLGFRIYGQIEKSVEFAKSTAITLSNVANGELFKKAEASSENSSNDSAPMRHPVPNEILSCDESLSALAKGVDVPVRDRTATIHPNSGRAYVYLAQFQTGLLPGKRTLLLKINEEYAPNHEGQSSLLLGCLTSEVTILAQVAGAGRDLEVLQVDDGVLYQVKPLWKREDPECCPSGERKKRLQWNGDSFEEE